MEKTLTEKINLARTDEDIRKCWLALSALRPHLLENEFVEKIKAFQSRGYYLIFVEVEGLAASVAGFRFSEHLLWGKIIYIDDLSTLPAMRGKGYGGKLLAWIKVFAKENGCAQVHLDSGHHRHDAHRLYLNQGFVIASHHFGLNI